MKSIDKKFRKILWLFLMESLNVHHKVKNRRFRIISEVEEEYIKQIKQIVRENIGKEKESLYKGWSENRQVDNAFRDGQIDGSNKHIKEMKEKFK